MAACCKTHRGSFDVHFAQPHIETGALAVDPPVVMSWLAALLPAPELQRLRTASASLSDLMNNINT